MLKTKWIEKKITYTGEELHSLFAYLNHGVLGDSVVAFRGPCEVSFDHMVDGEDLLEQAKIQGSDMVHFIFEIFDRPLFAGVLLQRLFAAVVIDMLKSLANANADAKSKVSVDLQRSGDDIYWQNKKLSISIATRSPNSIMIHFAVNVSNEGTPVLTCSLEDFGIEPQRFAEICLCSIQAEYESVLMATHKVKAVK